MSKEFKVFGPPGTGKTSRLATRDIPRAVAKFGPEKVLVTSFTRAAAHEIASKESRDTGERIPVAPNMVGTLHAHCYRSLGQPTLAEDKKIISEWNTANPDMAISGSGDVEDGLSEDRGGAAGGDKLLNQLNILRGRLIDPMLWPADIKAFAKRWRGFKNDTGSRDFTDLIDKAMDEQPYAPGNPRVGFLDEGQDFTPQQLKLARSWGSQMDFFILVGDDDQTIYRFTGADPRAFLEPAVPDNQKIILDQSWRVPRRVFRRAMDVIKRVGHREPKNYKPRKAEGKVREIDGHWRNPDDWIDDVADQLSKDREVMILASCSYMIDPLKNLLRSRGVPFANRFRQKRGDWNPLARLGNRVTAAALLSSFLSKGEDGDYWSVAQFVRWAKHLGAKGGPLVFKKGKKAIKYLEGRIKDDPMDPELYTVRDVISDILEPEALAPALERNVDWLVDSLVSSRKTGMIYPANVFKNHGRAGIEKAPKLTIGTIHSVKGGEADCVYLHPDISYNAQIEMDESRDAVDAAQRLFYVGMTRAREELVLMAPAIPRRGRTALYVDL